MRVLSEDVRVPPEKWLKDRKGRKLSFDDVEQYTRITSVVSETLRLMPLVDQAIAGHGGWPIR